LEELLGAKSFGGSIGHLVHHQATLPISLGEFGFFSMVWIVAPNSSSVGH
jgi:hypothetical protein